MDVRTIVNKILEKKELIRVTELALAMKYALTQPEIYRSWKSNDQFRNIHRDKRCFILGNGPSLMEIDLSLLKNEYVFSVNNFSKVRNFESAAPNYHLWIDMAFFDLRTDMKCDMDDVMKNYKKMSIVKPVCFVPREGYNFIKKNNLDGLLDIHYLSISDSVDNSDFNSRNTDLTSYILGMTTVVQYAVVIALYMGFKEIYLLGCDSTNIVTTLNCALNTKNARMHAYGNDNAENEISGLLKSWDMSRIFYDQYLLFLGYKKLYNYCQKIGARLVNLSSTTLINSIPKEKFETILRK